MDRLLPCAIFTRRIHSCACRWRSAWSTPCARSRSCWAVGAWAGAFSPRGAPLAAAALVVIAAGPALAGNVATRGTFTEMPLQWRAAGAWLDEHADQGGAIILPAASFGEYTWGRTIDEPLRSLTTTPYRRAGRGSPHARWHYSPAR